MNLNFNILGRLNSGGGASLLTPPTESELLAYIMANFPPDFFLDPEQGLVDSSGNGVTVTTNGSPTVNASGGLNDRGYIALDGVDDAVVVNRVDIGTHAICFRHNSAGIALMNVPTADTGSGDGPKFFKQGLIFNAAGYYQHYPDSGGTKKSVRTENIGASATWRTMFFKGEGYAYNNGRSVFASKQTAVADTTVTKMFYGCWGRGDGANLALFTAYDIGLSMIWNAELTADQSYIVQAYLEKRFDSFGNLTYQYKPETLDIEATNPIFNGNSYSELTQTQSYAGVVIPGAAIFKGYTKELYGFTSVDDDLLAWTDQDEVIGSGSSGQFDVDGCNISYFFLEGSVYNLIYGGRNSSNYEIGLATSNSPVSGYTKSGSNPIVTLSAVNSALSKSYTILYPIQVFKLESTYVLQFIGQSGVNACDVIEATGSSLLTLGNYAIKLSQGDTSLKDGLLYTTPTRDDSGWPEYCRYLTMGGVHRYGGKLISMVCPSNIFGDAFTNARSAVVFAAIADNENDRNWKTVASGLLIDTGGNNTWNKTQSYLASVIFNQDGEYLTPKVINDKWIVPFAGLGTTAEAINTSGQVGYAYAPKRIVKNLLS